MRGRVSRFSAPTRVVAGRGSLDLLPDELLDLGRGPVAVVSDRGVADAGLLDGVLEAAGTRRTLVCALCDPDPTTAAAEQAATAAREGGCELVLSVGGGSALGVGKAVALRLTNPQPVEAYAGRDRAPHAPVPHLAVPTTAGSGSEVSNALVLLDAAGDRLVVVRGRGYEPDVAVLDGDVLTSLPHAPMLYAGLDALSHALEALWTHAASPVTEALALAAARRIRLTLPRALRFRDPVDLQRLLETSMMANLACGNAGLGLVHALSSATAVRLPHGLQNGILLPHVARFNDAVLPAEARAEVQALDELYAELDFQASFSGREVPAGGADQMITAALGNTFRANNRRTSTAAQLREILAAAGLETRATVHGGPR